ncbi:MAG: hypothetical protein ABSE18_02115 [Minisyncoccia bacterium]|jgi:hypothetical protein
MEPSQEEITKAEEMMTDEQRAMSERREKEEEEKRALYGWHYMSKAPESIEKRLDKKEIFPGYSTFVEPGKYREYQKITPFAIYHHTYEPKDVSQMIKEGGLLSTKERLRRKLTTKGLSSDIDLQTGAAEFAFTRIVTPEGLANSKTKVDPGVVSLVFEPDIVDRLDWYSFNEDRHGGADPTTFRGRVSPEELFETQKKSWNYGNEQMFKIGIPIEKVKKIVCGTEEALVQLMVELQKSGIKEINGKPVEEMVALATLPDFIKISQGDDQDNNQKVREVLSRYKSYIADALKAETDNPDEGL